MGNYVTFDEPDADGWVSVRVVPSASRIGRIRGHVFNPLYPPIYLVTGELREIVEFMEAQKPQEGA